MKKPKDDGVGRFRLLHAVTLPGSVGTGPRKQMEQQWMGVSICVYNSQ
jgi:hypothetical protein